MNVTLSQSKREDLPSCFGEKWDPRSSECAGGPDASYTHPRNGSHVREACDFFSSCGARVQAQRVGSQLIPTTQLFRQPEFKRPEPPRAVTPPPMSTAAAMVPSFREFMQHRPPSQQVVAPQPIPQYQYHPMQGSSPGANYPAPTYQLQYTVPGYLSVPEARMPGQSVWSLLGREMVRAMGKALGHVVSNFFDVHPFRLPPGQGGNGQ